MDALADGAPRTVARHAMLRHLRTTTFLRGWRAIAAVV
jgi:hypothetical protein